MFNRLLGALLRKLGMKKRPVEAIEVDFINDLLEKLFILLILFFRFYTNNCNKYKLILQNDA